MIGTIVIPAHQEESCIAACLDALLAQDIAGWRVVVVANGCRDQTASVARSFSNRFADRAAEFLVEELDRGHKPTALNVGDARAEGRLRLYLDADVRMDPGCLAAMVRALEAQEQLGSRCLICFSRIAFDEQRSRWVSWYWRTWRVLNAVDEVPVMGGCIAMTVEGRARWAAHPDLISDDGYMLSAFEPAERSVVQDALARTTPASTIGEVVGVRARWLAGATQLSGHGAKGIPRGRVRRLARDPVTLVFLPLYVAIELRVRLASRRYSSSWYHLRTQGRSSADRRLHEEEPRAVGKRP